MSATTEFSRPLTLDAARRARSPVEVTAGAAERRALARRFDLVALDQLSATLALMVDDNAVLVNGTMTAAAIQSCVATAELVAASIVAPITIKLVPATASDTTDAEMEIELADDDLDVVDYDGAIIDLGELVAQSLALALDPWPRHPGADAILRAAGVKSEAESGAFGALAGLRDKLGKP